MTEAIKLMIGTPCFGGQLSTLYFASMFNLQSALRAYPNVEMTVQLRDGDALITRARANVVAAFLDDPKTTHLLFIDADIGFEPDQVLRLLSSGADVVAGTYPIKRINWDKVHKVIGTGKPNTRSAALDYVLEMKNPNHIAAVKGFARMRYAGTGFLMIKRHVLEKMCQYYQSLQFRHEHSTAEGLANSPNRFALFECIVDPETRTYLSEDFSFCKRWTDMGGEIWADLESRLNHVGPVTFYGDVATQFSSIKTNEAAA
jgi:hypothetical protein